MTLQRISTMKRGANVYTRCCAIVWKMSIKRLGKLRMHSRRNEFIALNIVYHHYKGSSSHTSSIITTIISVARSVARSHPHHYHTSLHRIARNSPPVLSTLQRYEPRPYFQPFNSTSPDVLLHRTGAPTARQSSGENTACGKFGGITLR